MQTITDEMDAAIDRLKERLERGVPPLMEASAHDLPLILRACVILRDHNVALASAGLELAAIVEDRATHDRLAMELGKPRAD